MKLTTGLGGVDRAAENLALDAFAFGSFLREAEAHLSEEPNTFDPEYLERLGNWAEDDPIMALSAGALSVAEGMPAAFSFADEVWEETVELAEFELIERQARILEALEEVDTAVVIPSEVRAEALRLGYGLCFSAQALDIEAMVSRA